MQKLLNVKITFLENYLFGKLLYVKITFLTITLCGNCFSKITCVKITLCENYFVGELLQVKITFFQKLLQVKITFLKIILCENYFFENCWSEMRSKGHFGASIYRRPVYLHCRTEHASACIAIILCKHIDSLIGGSLSDGVLSLISLVVFQVVPCCLVSCLLLVLVRLPTFLINNLLSRSNANKSMHGVTVDAVLCTM